MKSPANKISQVGRINAIKVEKEVKSGWHIDTQKQKKDKNGEEFTSF